MADSKSADSLPDVQEKEHGDGGSLVSGEASENGVPSQELDRMKEQLQVHIETIGFLVAEKTELESALTESQESAEAKQATVEELQKRLDGFSRCSIDSDGKCVCAASHTDQTPEVQRLDGLVSELNRKLEFAETQQKEQLETCRQLKSEKDSQTTTHDEIVQQLQIQVNTQNTTLSELQSRVDRTTEEKQQLEEQLRRQSEELNVLKDERESLRREHVQFAEQQTKSQEEASNVLKVENETLQKDQARRVEELDGKLRLLEQELNVLRNEKESLTRENAQTKEQLRQKDAMAGERTHQMEEGVKELLGERERLNRENAQLVEQLRLRDLSVEECKRQMEQLQGQRKQLEAQVSSLLNEKDQLLGRCDELQSLLKDLRLRYAVANEELSQSNETTQMVTDAYNKLKVQLDHTNQVAEAHATENQELSRNLDERVDSVRKLEATVERLKGTKTEHGHRLENRKTTSNGNSDDHGNPGIDNDLFEKYSNDVLEHLRQNAPLIDRLQKELSSAQDTINALTNQNSELKNRTRSNGNLNEGDALQSLSRVEMERNRLKEELEQLRRQHRSLEEKMELTEEDLARQVPSTVNGDVVVRAQFDALQSVMKRLEAKYTQVMRDKAELMDTTERLEHIITQLQDESNTIGEYVSLYHQQRFVQRQRTAEKDGYIYQLAHERLALQNRLAQLQALILQLLNERHVLDTSNHETERQVALAGHESPVTEGHDAGRPIEMNGEGQDESSSGQQIPNTNHSSESGCESHQNGSDFHSPGQHSSLSHPLSNIPVDKETAQKIMYLLNEIGTSQLVDGRPYEDKNHVRCGHCSGRILIA